MLSRLRHRPIIGGDDQQHQVDASRARYHVVDKTLVTGHIHKAERANSCHGAIREAEIDRDAARLFLGQPIGVDTGQRAHQRSLAVIDVAGGADNHTSGWSAGAGEQKRVRREPPPARLVDQYVEREGR
jgi:hypothetical protein